MFLKALLLTPPPEGTLPAEGALPPVPPEPLVGAGAPVLRDDTPGTLDILVEDPVDALVKEVLLLILWAEMLLVVLLRTLERGVVEAMGLSGHGVVRAVVDVLDWDGTDEGGGA